MKKLFISLLFTCLLAPAFAQRGAKGDAPGFAELWRRVEEAQRDDLPATALKSVRAIERKAAREGHDGHLLGAALMRRALADRIAPDSGSVALEAMEAACRRETRRAEKTVWHAALAHLYHSLAGGWDYRRNDTALVNRALAHYAAAAEEMECLAEVTTAQYAPLLNLAADSKAFGNDVLHVFVNDYAECPLIADSARMALTARAEAAYERRGNADAALLLAVKRRQLADAAAPRAFGEAEEDRAFEACKAAYLDIARRFAGRPLNVETYIALITACENFVQGQGETFTPGDERRMKALHDIAREAKRLHKGQKRAAWFDWFIDRTTVPMLHSTNTPAVVYPGDAYKAALYLRNLAEVEVRLVRIGLSALQFDNLDNHERDLKKHFQERAATRLLRLSPAPAYAWRTDSLHITLPEQPGLYRLEVRTGGKLLSANVLHVTRLRPMWLALNDESCRMVAVDARSGHPVAGARLIATSADRRGKRVQKKATALAPEGSIVGHLDFSYQNNYYITCGNDNALPAFSLMRPYFGHADSTARTNVDVWLDRAVYRSGQKVLVGGAVYSTRGDEARTEKGVVVEVRLRAARNHSRVIDSLEVVADEFGTFAGTLQLNAPSLPGTYFVEAKLKGGAYNAGGTRYFNVEAYKRPTFAVKSLPLTAAYAAGDSVALTGEARTFTDLPVEGGRVRWTMTRQTWWRNPYYAGRNDFKTLRGEALTDEKGRFKLNIALPALSDEERAMPLFRYTYVVSYDVTAPNGETAEGSFALFTASRPAWFENTLPERLRRDRIGSVTAFLRNASGHNIEGRGFYRLLSSDGREVCRDTFATGRAFTPESWRHLPSGGYMVEWNSERPGVAADTSKVVLFSEDDVRPPVYTPLWTDITPADEAGNAALGIGTSMGDVMMFVDIYNENGVYESQRVALTDSIVRFALPYRAEYGEGATASFAFLRDGILYKQRINIAKPLPQRKLQLKWRTFRSRLTPGGREEWRLAVTDETGAAVNASVVARLYDASLNKFGRAGLGFTHLRTNRQPLLAGHLATGLQHHGFSLFGALWRSRNYDCPEPSYTTWRHECFAPYYGKAMLAEAALADFDGTPVRYKNSANARQAPAMLKSATNDAAPAMGTAEQTAAGDLSNERGAGTAEEAAAESFDATAGNGSGSAAPASLARKNFAETAFFYPQLRTNENGEAVISFTLPESLTEWQFDALAHTLDLRHAMLDTTVVARKTLMLQPALPRFVRQGDLTALPATLRNLAEESVEAEVAIAVLDAETERPIFNDRKRVKVEAGGATDLQFFYESKKDGTRAIIVRLSAESDKFADGEEHLLPVLSANETVTRTLTFSADAPETLKLALDTLWQSGATQRSLTVEGTSNALWYAAQALPSLIDDAENGTNAVKAAENYYALALTAFAAKLQPELKEHAGQAAQAARNHGLLKHAENLESTPWLENVEAEAARARALGELFDDELNAARSTSALHRLKTLQNADGAWPWHAGMPATPFITTEVAVLLARVEALTGNDAARSMLDKAEAYLDKELEKEVERMKKAEKAHNVDLRPAEWTLRLLYLKALRDEKPSKAADYLLDKAERRQLQLSMYGKSVLAVILQKAGRAEAAKKQLQGVLEHTVCSKENGRYFDTERALRNQSSYRLASQTAAIEALRQIGSAETSVRNGGHAPSTALPATANGSYAKAEKEMTLWLLQSRRTQGWETSRATTDALYALFTAQAPAAPGSLAKAEPLRFTLYKASAPISVSASKHVAYGNTAGYVRLHFDEKAAPADAAAGSPNAPSGGKGKQAPSALDATSLSVTKFGSTLSWGSVTATYSLPAAEVKAYANGLRVERRFEMLDESTGEWLPLNHKRFRRNAARHRNAAEPTAATGRRVRQIFTLTADRDYDYVTLRADRAACLEPLRPLSGYMTAEGYEGTLHYAPAFYRAIDDHAISYHLHRLPKGTHRFVETYRTDRPGRYATGLVRLISAFAPEFSAHTGEETITVE